MNIETIQDWLLSHPELSQLLAILVIFLCAYLGYFITKRYIFRGLKKLIRKSKTEWDDLILNQIFLRRLAYFVPLLIIYNFAYLIPAAEIIIQQICIIMLLITFLLLTGDFLTSLNQIYERSGLSKGRPIKGVIQIVKIFIYIIGGIIIVSILIGKSPWFFISGIGAMTAVVLLIFRDTILSFVASLQISSNDLVRIGDWIEVPGFGADGDVLDIALHTIKVQNWDKTITVIPTHKLIEVSFKNWRGMTQSGGRRIKRALYIDQSSIKFCNKTMVEKFSGFHLIRDYVKEKQQELLEYNKKYGYTDDNLVNGRRMTNIGTFRAYVIAYLKQSNKVHQGLTSMVRQLAPGPNGLPLEIYVFTNDTAWVRYEAIQSDIFDHLLAVIPEFELQIFQNPSGSDFQSLGEKAAINAEL